MFKGSLFGPSIRAGIYRYASRIYGSRSVHQLCAPPQVAGLIKNPQNETRLDSSMYRNMGMNLVWSRVAENTTMPSLLSFRSFIHSGEPREVEEGRTTGPMDPLQGLHGEVQSDVDGQSPSYKPQAEAGRTRMAYFRDIRQGLVNDANRLPAPLFGGARTPRSMDYVQGLLSEERGNVLGGGGPLYQPRGGDTGRTLRPTNALSGQTTLPYQVETNADIVHIKLARNNSYVTLTDSKGNKKAGITAAMAAAKGEKPGRYSAEAAAEHIGRRAREMRIRSVVVKVSGCTFFKKKKDAILAFKDGYSSSRGEVNPIVYIEDTTRKPHNGCRLPKKRRI